MAKKLLRAALVGAVLLPVGCHQLQSDYNDCVTAKRDTMQAQMAWWRCHKAYKGQIDYLQDFGAGFRAGYLDILNGGAGCPPTLPPENYWYVKYQNATGKERIAAWFAGFSEGVAVATSEGVRGQNYIPLSPFRQAQMQSWAHGPSGDPIGTAPAMPAHPEMIPPAPGAGGAVPAEEALPLAPPVTRRSEQRPLSPAEVGAEPLAIEAYESGGTTDSAIDPTGLETTEEFELPAGLSGLSSPEP